MFGKTFISVKKKESGNLVRMPSGGERAWFLEEESEPMTMRILIDLFGKSIGVSKWVRPLVAR